MALMTYIVRHVYVGIFFGYVETVGTDAQCEAMTFCSLGKFFLLYDV